MSPEELPVENGATNDEPMAASFLNERFRNIAAGAVVSVEANLLINDGGRIAATSAIFAATHDPKLTSLAFAGMTFGIEAAGAWGASRMLETQRGKSFIEKTHRILEKAHITRYVSGVVPDAAVAMTLGTSVMLAAKQSKSPNRTSHENLRYGTAMALGATAIATAEVFGLSTSISEGLSNPSPITAGIGIVSLAAMVKGADVLARRIKVDSKITRGVELYRKRFDTHANGPQVEGLSPEEIVKASSDQRSLFINATNKAKLPVLVPVEHNGEYNKHYFDTHFPNTEVYHFSDIFKRLQSTEIDRGAAIVAVSDKLKALAGQEAVIVTDQMESANQFQSNLEYLLENNGIKYEKTFFNDPRNGAPAAVTHFSGEGKMQFPIRKDGFRPASSYKEAFKRLQVKNPERYENTYGTVLIEPEDITDKLFEDIWALYSPQFDELIKENPSMQAQTKADLRNTLKSDGSLLVASFEEGKPVCVAYFVTDISKVYWLRKEYYEKAFPDQTVWYFPGIAVDAKYEGLARSMSVIGLATEIAYECDLEPTITFQCTNMSKDYVPKIATFAIEHTGLYKIAFNPIAKYGYVGYELESPGKTV